MGRIKNLQRQVDRLEKIVNGIVDAEDKGSSESGYHQTSASGGYHISGVGFNEPPIPETNFEKWRQTYWWKSSQGWIPLSNMHPNHVENVVLMIEENPHYFTNHIRSEVAQVFQQRFDPTNVSIETALRASLDLIWMDSYPYEYMTASPLYKALKELHDANEED